MKNSGSKSYSDSQVMRKKEGEKFSSIFVSVMYLQKGKTFLWKTLLVTIIHTNTNKQIQAFIISMIPLEQKVIY